MLHIKAFHDLNLDPIQEGFHVLTTLFNEAPNEWILA